MYKIYIDASDRYQRKVRISKEDQVLDEVVGDIDMVVTIKKLLEKHNLRIEDVEVFETNKGPGSFTGLKVGVSIANALNWALGKKSINELDYPEYGGGPNITLKEGV